jgi:hypothetical protein
MASFYAYDFEYDGIPSARFDLKIVTFEDGGLMSGIGSANVSVLSQRVLRKSKPYYLGRTQEPVLEFPLTFASPNTISGLDRDLISAWLFGRAEYHKLYILQDDLNGAYFNCMFKDPEPQYVGNMNYAFTCTVSCDSPFAYGPEKTVSGSLVGTNRDIEIYNSSSEDEYLYPTVHFIMNQTGPSTPTMAFSIINHSDNEREFAFVDIPFISSFEVTMDNDMQIITSDTTGLLTYFNNKWLRLVPKINYITFYSPGTVNLFEVKYTERFKIGG